MRSSSRLPMVSINSNSTAFSTREASIFCMAQTFSCQAFLLCLGDVGA